MTVLCLTEKDLNTKCVVEMDKNQTILHPAGGNLSKGDSRCVCVCVWSGGEYVVILWYVVCGNFVTCSPRLTVWDYMSQN